MLYIMHMHTIDTILCSITNGLYILYMFCRTETITNTTYVHVYAICTRLTGSSAPEMIGKVAILRTGLDKFQLDQARIEGR